MGVSVAIGYNKRKKKELYCSNLVFRFKWFGSVNSKKFGLFTFNFVIKGHFLRLSPVENRLNGGEAFALNS